MDTVLVDTSVWINVFKGKETNASLYLKNNLSNIIIATCPTIVQEVLQGIVSDSEFKKMAAYFNSLAKLTGSTYIFAQDAAKLYRELRKNGVTIRKPNDCLIAMFAIKTDIQLLEDDRDFKMIAKYAPLKLAI